MKIQTFLTFLRSLDPDNVENSIDEKTILSLFSVDEQMTSSIYVIDDVRELKVVPKSLLHSLKQSNEDEEVINKVDLPRSSFDRSNCSFPLSDSNGIIDKKQDIEKNIQFRVESAHYSDRFEFY